jgi:hypothetical protein
MVPGSRWVTWLKGVDEALEVFLMVMEGKVVAIEL